MWEENFLRRLLHNFCLSVCRKMFGPGDKVTFNGADYMCNSCANQLPASQKATPCTPPPSLNGLDGGLATSTPVRVSQGLQLGSPVSDVSDLSNGSKYRRWVYIKVELELTCLIAIFCFCCSDASWDVVVVVADALWDVSVLQMHCGMLLLLMHCGMLLLLQMHCGMLWFLQMHGGMFLHCCCRPVKLTYLNVLCVGMWMYISDAHIYYLWWGRVNLMGRD